MSAQLWFDRPAASCFEALPLGNGWVGVMAHGGVEVEHLQVNDATAWVCHLRGNGTTVADARATGLEPLGARPFRGRSNRSR